MNLGGVVWWPGERIDVMGNNEDGEGNSVDVRRKKGEDRVG